MPDAGQRPRPALPPGTETSAAAGEGAAAAPANVNVSVSGISQVGAQPAGRSNGLAVAGFVCSLVALVMFWVPGLNFILWVLGIVFSAIGLSAARRHAAPHRGLAIAGLVIALVPGTLLLLVVFAVVIAAA